MPSRLDLPRGVGNLLPVVYIIEYMESTCRGYVDHISRRRWRRWWGGQHRLWGQLQGWARRNSQAIGSLRNCGKQLNFRWKFDHHHSGVGRGGKHGRWNFQHCARRYDRGVIPRWCCQLPNRFWCRYRNIVKLLGLICNLRGQWWWLSERRGHERWLGLQQSSQFLQWRR